MPIADLSAAKRIHSILTYRRNWKSAIFIPATHYRFFCSCKYQRKYY